MTRNQLLYQISFLFLLFSSASYAFEQDTRLWGTAVIIGPLSADKKIKYYIEPQLRFVDNTYKFNQAFLFSALGYQVSPRVTLFLGPGITFVKTLQGEFHKEYRIFQQTNWSIHDADGILLNSRTRLEFRWLSNNSHVNERVRQRFWLRALLPHSDKIYFSTFDEVFFNLNQPSWTQQHVFVQNRAFAGLGFSLSKSTMLDVGYLNMYLRSEPVQMNNVLLLSFSINL